MIGEHDIKVSRPFQVPDFRLRFNFPSHVRKFFKTAIEQCKAALENAQNDASRTASRRPAGRPQKENSVIFHGKCLLERQERTTNPVISGPFSGRAAAADEWSTFGEMWSAKAKVGSPNVFVLFCKPDPRVDFLQQRLCAAAARAIILTLPT